VEALLFWTFAAVSVAGGTVAITRRNPLASALALAVVLVAIAGLFALLDAHLLFILQILVYAGAIVVLIVFVIMLLNLGDEDLREDADPAREVRGRGGGVRGGLLSSPSGPCAASPTSASRSGRRSGRRRPSRSSYSGRF